MLWIYYAMIKKDANLLITINSVGCVIESVYIVLFLYYATKKGRVQILKLYPPFLNCFFSTQIFDILVIVNNATYDYFQVLTVKILILLNVFGFGLMFLLTLFLAKGLKRVNILGWICLVFNLSVFAAPLCILVRT